MNLCRALRSRCLSERKCVCFGSWPMEGGGNLFRGFGVITFCFGGGRARGWGLISGSFFGGGTGRRLICVVKIGGWGSRGPFRGFRFGFFYNGGAERAEEDLIGTTVFAEKRTTFKVSRRLECRGPPTVCHSVWGSYWDLIKYWNWKSQTQASSLDCLIGVESRSV